MNKKQRRKQRQENFKAILVAGVAAAIGIIPQIYDTNVKAAEPDKPTVSYSCPAERQKAVEFHKAYPQIDQEYKGEIEAQCQLNEVIVDADRAALVPKTDNGAGG